MSSIDIYCLLVISFFCGLLRGTVAIGPAVVFLSASTLFLNPTDAISLSALIDILSGAIAFAFLFAKDRIRISLQNVFFFMVFSALGTLIFNELTVSDQKKILAAVFLLAIPILFAASNSRIDCQREGEHINLDLLNPTKPYLIILSIAGFVGGLSGMPGPVLSIYFLFKRLSAKRMRDILIPLLLCGAISRSITVSAQESAYMHRQT